MFINDTLAKYGDNTSYNLILRHFRHMTSTMDRLTRRSALDDMDTDPPFPLNTITARRYLKEPAKGIQSKLHPRHRRLIRDYRKRTSFGN